MRYFGELSLIMRFLQPILALACGLAGLVYVTPILPPGLVYSAGGAAAVMLLFYAALDLVGAVEELKLYLNPVEDEKTPTGRP